MMSLATLSLREDYWDTFELTDEDREFIYNYLLEVETPLTSPELLAALVNERICQEKLAIEKQRTSGGEIYKPADIFMIEQDLVFPAFGWQHATVLTIRPGQNPNIGGFQVIRVKFDNQETREFASNIQDHLLNQPQEISVTEITLDVDMVLSNYGEKLLEIIDTDLVKNQEFVRIAGKWFPRALLVDINAGHLNIAEAILDMAGGGPLPTKTLLEQVGLTSNTNSNLVEFSSITPYRRIHASMRSDPQVKPFGFSIAWNLRASCRCQPTCVISHWNMMPQFLLMICSSLNASWTTNYPT